MTRAFHNLVCCRHLAAGLPHVDTRRRGRDRAVHHASFVSAEESGAGGVVGRSDLEVVHVAIAERWDVFEARAKLADLDAIDAAIARRADRVARREDRWS